MDSYTTGQVARAARISEKAVRIYADRGMLPVRHDRPGDRRRFTADALWTARTIGLLRGLDLSLASISTILESCDSLAAFDATWGEQVTQQRATLASGEYVRSVLAGAPRLDVEMLDRTVPERLTLDWHGTSTLLQMAETITGTTQMLFDTLRREGVDLAGSPFVEHHERATTTSAARISVRVPVVALVRPAGTCSLSVDPAHDEIYVQLDQGQAQDQAHLVAVHDYLSSGSLGTARPPVGDNRELYLPSWGTGADGPVMEIATPVAQEA